MKQFGYFFGRIAEKRVVVKFQFYRHYEMFPEVYCWIKMG